MEYMEEEKNILIKFENVSKVYKGGFTALENINLEIAEGEFVSIIGPSGAGKSTLLKLIYAEEMPSEGDVYFNSVLLKGLSRRKLPFHRRMIGTVFQDFALLPGKTAYENVSYALEVLGVPTAEIAEDVPQILDIVGMLDKKDKFPEQLSGGEKQRIAIARALIHKPLIIVADEPTVSLDPDSAMAIMELLVKINSYGTTIILASHQKDIINKVQKRVILIDAGTIVNDCPNGKYKLK